MATPTPGIQPALSVSLQLVNLGTVDKDLFFSPDRDAGLLEMADKWEPIKKKAVELAYQQLKVSDIPVYVKIKSNDAEKTELALEKAGLKVIDKHADPKNQDTLFVSFIKA